MTHLGVSAIHFAGEFIHYLNQVQEELEAKAPKDSEFMPAAATFKVFSATSAVSLASWALRPVTSSTSLTIERMSSIDCTWRIVPVATSWIADAISPTARPVSSEVDAICTEAAETVVALPATWAISADSSWREVL